MTRINVGIEPKELGDKHLLAEHREIKRIPNAVRSGKAIIKDIPKTFCLGKGHVKFFYDKLDYLFTRYTKIYAECQLRGFNVQYYGDAFGNISYELWNNYTETERDRKIVQERIKLKTL